MLTLDTFTGPTWACSQRERGSIERTDLDGKNRKTIVPEVHVYAKAAPLDKKMAKLFVGIAKGCDHGSNLMFELEPS